MRLNKFQIYSFKKDMDALLDIPQIPSHHQYANYIVCEENKSFKEAGYFFKSIRNARKFIGLNSMIHQKTIMYYLTQDIVTNNQGILVNRTIADKKNIVR